MCWPILHQDHSRPLNSVLSKFENLSVHVVGEVKNVRYNNFQMSFSEALDTTPDVDLMDLDEAIAPELPVQAPLRELSADQINCLDPCRYF